MVFGLAKRLVTSSSLAAVPWHWPHLRYVNGLSHGNRVRILAALTLRLPLAARLPLETQSGCGGDPVRGRCNRSPDAALPSIAAVSSVPGVWETWVRFADRSASRRFGGVAIAAVALCLAAPIGPAAAGSLFETLFGVFRGQPAPREQAPPGSPYADPLLGERHSAGESSFGHGTVFCVRTCDGRYFPLQRVGAASPADACHSFCPASRTMVFSGGKIDTAIAPN